MKFVGKTSVAVIKCAILGGPANEFPPIPPLLSSARKKRVRKGCWAEEEVEEEGELPVHRWDP